NLRCTVRGCPPVGGRVRLHLLGSHRILQKGGSPTPLLISKRGAILNRITGGARRGSPYPARSRTHVRAWTTGHAIRRSSAVPAGVRRTRSLPSRTVASSVLRSSLAGPCVILPVRTSKQERCHGHITWPSRKLPSDRGPKRCVQNSWKAWNRPS